MSNEKFDDDVVVTLERINTASPVNWAEVDEALRENPQAFDSNWVEHVTFTNQQPKLREYTVSVREELERKLLPTRPGSTPVTDKETDIVEERRYSDFYPIEVDVALHQLRQYQSSAASQTLGPTPVADKKIERSNSQGNLKGQQDDENTSPSGKDNTDTSFVELVKQQNSSRNATSSPVSPRNP